MFKAIRRIFKKGSVRGGRAGLKRKGPYDWPSPPEPGFAFELTPADIAKENAARQARDHERDRVMAELEGAIELAERGQGAEAIELAEIAVEISRRLGTEYSEAPFGTYVDVCPMIARSLHVLACCLASVGRKEEVLMACRESVALGERLNRGLFREQISQSKKTLSALSG